MQSGKETIVEPYAENIRRYVTAFRRDMPTPFQGRILYTSIFGEKNPTR